MKIKMLVVLFALLVVEPLKVFYLPQPCSTPLPSGEVNSQTAIRQRCMEVRNIFLDSSGNPKDLEGKQLRLNFFADAEFLGTVLESGYDGSTYVWSGWIDGVVNSTFYVMYDGEFTIYASNPTKGVFIGQLESGDRYKILEIEYQ